MHDLYLGVEPQLAAESHSPMGMPDFMLPQLDDMLTEPYIGNDVFTQKT